MVSLLSVSLDVLLCGVAGVLQRVFVMSAREMRVVSGLLVMALLVPDEPLPAGA